MVSIIIPARNEPYLNNTLKDLLEKAKGKIEIIVTLEGYWPDGIVVDNKITYIHNGEPKGMRDAINMAVALAKGDYILKCDAHCMFDEGFDIKLTEHHKEDNWISVPRRYPLDVSRWQIEERKDNKYPIDYMFLSSNMKGEVWVEKNQDKTLKEKMIDDLMSAQGSCWFMKRDYFYELELEDSINYGTFANEFQEVGLKCWLSGGRVIRNKYTWYAHWHKSKQDGRGYSLESEDVKKANDYTKKWLTDSAWSKQKLPINWLINKFYPVPTWPNPTKEEEV